MADDAKQADHLEIAVGSLMLIAAKCEERQLDGFSAEIHKTAMTALNEIYGEAALKSALEELVNRDRID